MKTILAKTMELKGSSYEIGQALGRTVNEIPPLKNFYTSGFEGFGSKEVKEVRALFEKWCPGLSEELNGFADQVHAAPESVIYYAMTYLRPGCSHLALLPSKTANRHPLIARNYEFNDESEDFNLVKTSVNGKYSHIGTSVLSFGRDDGFNEQGLAVTMSSCGFPVGAQKGMRQPALKGLQFWAVIRALLENCRDTKEALSYLEGMPIAYNLNLILLDKTGCGALVETLDGKTAVCRIDNTKETPYLHASNHPVMDELIALEPYGMANSIKRYDYMKNFAESKDTISVNDLKNILLSPYPNGLCCHHYKDFFGTTKSMVIDPMDGTIQICWGGREENGWHTYRLSDPLPYSEHKITINNVPAQAALFRLEPLKSS